MIKTQLIRKSHFYLRFIAYAFSFLLLAVNLMILFNLDLSSRAIIFHILLIIISFFFLVGLYLNIFLYYRICVVSAFIPIFVMNYYLTYNYYGFSFQNSKSKMELVKKFRENGKDVFPYVSPVSRTYWPDGIKIHSKRIVAFGGVANVDTIDCDEGEGFSRWKSDRYGFNNPDYVWDEAVDIVLLGDSFVLGACVPNKNHFAAILRKGNANVLSLGVSGTGPLAQYAIYREYIGTLKRSPKLVFWFYFEGNDFFRFSPRDVNEVEKDFQKEFANNKLRAYLDETHSQHLVVLAEQINQRLRDNVNSIISKRFKRDREKSSFKLAELRWAMYNFFSFQSILSMIRPYLDPIDWKAEMREAERLLPAYRRAISQLRSSIEQVGGELVIVYLPSKTAFLPAWAAASGNHPLKETLIRLVESENIKIVDIQRVFSQQGNRNDLFNAHYSSRGYGLIAKNLSKYIERSSLVFGSKRSDQSAQN